MHQRSNQYKRWVSALLPISLLLATGCKEGSKAAVETGASSVQEEEVAPTNVATATTKPNLDEAPAPRVAAGGTVALHSVLQDSAVALVFYRSAVW